MAVSASVLVLRLPRPVGRAPWSATHRHPPLAACPLSPPALPFNSSPPSPPHTHMHARTHTPASATSGTMCLKLGHWVDAEARNVAKPAPAAWSGRSWHESTWATSASKHARIDAHTHTRPHTTCRVNEAARTPAHGPPSPLAPQQSPRTLAAQQRLLLRVALEEPGGVSGPLPPPQPQRLDRPQHLRVGGRRRRAPPVRLAVCAVGGGGSCV
jgi:hypothetical protein